MTRLTKGQILAWVLTTLGPLLGKLIVLGIAILPGKNHTWIGCYWNMNWFILKHGLIDPQDIDWLILQHRLVIPERWISWFRKMDQLILKHGLIDLEAWIGWSWNMKWLILKHGLVDPESWIGRFRNMDCLILKHGMIVLKKNYISETYSWGQKSFDKCLKQYYKNTFFCFFTEIL